MDRAIEADIELFPELVWGEVCCEIMPALGIDVDNEAIAAAISCCCVASEFCTATLLTSELGTETVVMAFVTSPRCCESWFGWLEMWACGICTTSGIFDAAPGLETVKLLVVSKALPERDDAAIDRLLLDRTTKMIALQDIN